MTNQEAIETLRANYPDACYEQLREAVDAAIEALKAQDATGDTISRQAVIDALEKVADLYYYNEAWNYAIGRAEMEIEKLSSVQQEPPWIPCSERLPDNDESVLISNSHGVTKAWWNGRFWSSIAVKKYKTVTAWMPLPEPYRGEGEEQC